MASSITNDWWQYSRWMWIISRSLKMNTPSAGELTALETFVDAFWNASAQTGTRSWLAEKINQKGANYEAEAAADEATPNLIKQMGVIARDVKKIPLTTAEGTTCDTMIAATGNRRYGDKANLV